jgi:tetratricopeptide (TPR) repeat protein
MSQYRKALNDAEKETSLNVFVTWELSFQQLATDDVDGSKASILTLLAFFDPNDISEELFKRFCNGTHLSPGNSELLAKCLLPRRPIADDDLEAVPDGVIEHWDRDGFADVIGSLRQLSLIQSFEISEDGYYHVSLHPLVKEWIKLRISMEAASDYFDCAARILRFVVSDVPSVPTSKINPQLARRWAIPHLVELDRSFQEIFEIRNAPLRQQPYDVFQKFGDAFNAWSRHKEALSWYARSLESGEALYGPNSMNILPIIYSLAWALRSLEDYEAAKTLASRILAIGNENFELDSGFNLRAMDMLASIFTDLNMYDEAEKLHREVVQISEGSGVYLGNFGWMLRCANKLEESEAILRKACLIAQSAFGPDHSTTLSTVNNHADVLLSLGRLEEAEKISRDMLERCQRTLGPDHDTTIYGMTTLAMVIFEKGDIALARTLCQHTLSWRIEKYGVTSRQVVESAELLAKINATEEALQGKLNKEPAAEFCGDKGV